MSSAGEEVAMCIEEAEKVFGVKEHRRVAFFVGPLAKRVTSWRVMEVAWATCCKEYNGQDDNSEWGQAEAGEGGLFRSQQPPSSPRTIVCYIGHFNGMLSTRDSYNPPNKTTSLFYLMLSPL